MALQAQPILDAVRAQLPRWEVPSISYAVVQGDQIVLAGGAGLSDGRARPADGKTLYQIASCSKAFTATAAALLATDGALDLDAPVREYLPAFRLPDSYAGDHLTTRDFLSHRSGLPRHEYAWYGTGFTRSELMENLRYLPLTAPIRYTFQYSNFNYLVVGCLVEAVSGLPFEEFLVRRLFRPLGMERTYAYHARAREAGNHALAFDRDEPFVMAGCREIPFYRSPAEADGVGDPTAAAGCVVSCAEDMARWLRFQLGRGALDGRRLVRPEWMDLQHTPHVAMELDPSYAPQRTDSAYCLGWFLHHYRGLRMLEHGGNIDGFASAAALVPELDLGVFASVNMTSSLLAEAFVYDVVDRALGAADTDWYGRLYRANGDLYDRIRARTAAVGGAPVAGTRPSHDLSAYVGVYEAPGYRPMRVFLRDGQLALEFNTFTVGLRHHHYDAFTTDGVIGELPPGLVLTFSAEPQGGIHQVEALLGSEPGLQPTVFRRPAARDGREAAV